MVKIDKEHKRVYTDLFTKDTDTHNYLHYTSAHPIHCKKKEAHLERNCQKLTDFEEHANARVSDYLRRGYPKEDLEKALDKARKTNREAALRARECPKNKKERIPLILTFNPANPKMTTIIN